MAREYGSLYQLESPPESEKFPLDAIIVLGSRISRDNNGSYIYPNGESNSAGIKYMGARTRALGVRQALDEKLTNKFLITGGKFTTDKGSTQSRSELFTQFASQRHHIPKDSLISIGEIGNTLGNLQDAQEYIGNHSEMLSCRKIGLLSNFFHLPRVMATVDAYHLFQNEPVDLFVLSAEELMIRRDPRFSASISNAYRSSEMGEFIQRELQGIRDLKNGVYAPISQKQY